MKNDRGPRVNQEIRAREVRVVDETGKQLGTVSLERALEIARSRNLDLVEVAPNSLPPVCRLLNYDQYRYARSKKGKDQKKKQKGTSCKEVWLRPNTGKHDLEFKLKRVREFLEEGHQVRVRLRFRGREITYQKVADEILQRFIETCKDISQVNTHPKVEGKHMIMILSPK